jgi:hypothetical protein
MSSTVDVESALLASSLTSAADYLGLTVEQRYAVISEKFPAWLLAEPIAFPEHDRTYGWACRVVGCDAAPTDMQQQAMCWQHSHEYRQVKDSIGLDEFLRQAEPRRSQRGRGLIRRADCRICGSNREVRTSGYCRNHVKSYGNMRRRRGFDEKTWRQSQQPFPPLPTCVTRRCVHDGEHYPTEVFDSRPACEVHYEQWLRWLEKSGNDRDQAAWAVWSALAADDDYLRPASSRGEVSLAHLPDRLQREIRYAIYRHARTAERTHWRPVDIQKVADALAAAGIQSLSEPGVAALQARSKHATGERRVWLRLPAAARSLSVYSATAKPRDGSIR